MDSALVSCSCGSSKPHVIGRRNTADGVVVQLWDDGTVTGRMGYALPGVPLVRAETSELRAVALRAGWLLIGELESRDASDLGDLYAASRWAAKRGRLPGDVRARLAHMQRLVLRPVWMVLRADRDGRPTERVWRLPRLRWPGLAVWDRVNHGRGGRYEVVTIDRDNVCEATGFSFSTLAALTEHLLGQCEMTRRSAEAGR